MHIQKHQHHVANDFSFIHHQSNPTSTHPRWQITAFFLSGLFCLLLLPGGSASAAIGSNSQLSTGDAHACVLTTGGGVQCWGNNASGQLGDGSKTDRKLPVNVVGLSHGVVEIAVGGVHSCALTEKGVVKCWGANSSGQLGDSSNDESTIPVDVSGLDSGVLSISSGFLHSCAITVQGAAHCWGDNAYGQLGDNSKTSSNQPVQVSGLLKGTKSISAGEYHSCALNSSGDAMCWGYNENGQLGDGNSGAGLTSTTPVAVNGLGSSVQSISAGGYHSCAVTANNTAQCWGFNDSGQLGDQSNAQSPSPVNVFGLTGNSAKVVAGLFHSCAINTDGAAQCWGNNFYGQLGNNNAGADSNSPVDVSLLDSGMMDISANDFFTCAISGGGSVHCWGDNTSGQLGDNSNSQQASPVNALGLAGLRTVSAGNRHACSINTNGALQCWGDNDFAQLGNNDTQDSAIPVLAADFHNGVAAVSPGSDSSCIITNQGAAMCWGSNWAGQLGNGDYQNTSIPVAVIGLGANVTSISTGRSHACAVQNGAAFCWGNGNQGKLGDGTGSGSNQPVAVSGLASGVQSVSVGDAHSCALLLNGDVRCWGDNTPGQLGDGSNDDSDVPVSPTGISNAIALGSGGEHSCAVLADNTVRCWGRGTSGQLGQSSLSGSASPVTVTNLNTATEIELGNIHSCAVLLDKTAQCWGSNLSGRLGSGSNAAYQAAPATVLGLNNVLAISAGGESSCAAIATGEIKCWGNNSSGQLGRVGTLSYTPIATRGFNNITAVAAGNKHNCLVSADGSVSCWGDNESGQLGTADFNDKSFPTEVAGLENITSLAAGVNHSCARAQDQSVSCWGNNSSGQLGIPAGAASNIPVLAPGVTSAITISAGNYFNCAQTSNTSIQCWGQNDAGQLGNNDTANSDMPVSVIFSGAGLSGVRNLVSGYNHSCAIKNDVVYCWGSNQYGQLGVGDEDDRHVGTAIAGLTGVSELSAGGYHTCALMNDETMKCWGRNFGGQLGTGDFTPSNTPQNVIGISNVSAIAMGSDHTCAITTGDALKCWGWNSRGQLGDKSLNESPSPVDVAQLNYSVVAITGGEEHTCAITDTGTIKCWGWNDDGQIGNGSTTSVSQWAEAFPLKQQIGFTPPEYVDTKSPIQLAGMSPSGLGLVFDSWTPATCSNLSDMVTPISIGYCGVRASQRGNFTYAAAPHQKRNILMFFQELFLDSFEE